ncbi:MAG: LytTR family DNA-binding domain-containing protein [Actinomycetota bacterium]|nr:LytTR family DNA-binding domain-containing protein [Actinomycetota bacterium]
MIRALVVDDEEPARGELRYLLSAHPEVDVVGEAASAGEALALAEKVRYDVVFLDVELPGMTGLEVARLVLERPEHPEVVFVTAHQRYAVAAFAVEAFDYLVKPVEPERLARVVERLSQARKRQRPEVEKIAVVSAGGAQTLLDYDAVYWIEADGDYSRVHTFDRPYLSTSSLRELAELLSSSRFARIHRSHLVNLGKVAEVRRAGPDRLRLVLDDKTRTELDVARRQTRALREQLRL